MEKWVWKSDSAALAEPGVGGWGEEWSQSLHKILLGQVTAVGSELRVRFCLDFDMFLVLRNEKR